MRYVQLCTVIVHIANGEYMCLCLFIFMFGVQMFRVYRVYKYIYHAFMF